MQPISFIYFLYVNLKFFEATQGKIPSHQGFRRCARRRAAGGEYHLGSTRICNNNNSSHSPPFTNLHASGSGLVRLQAFSIAKPKNNPLTSGDVKIFSREGISITCCFFSSIFLVCRLVVTDDEVTLCSKFYCQYLNSYYINLVTLQPPGGLSTPFALRKQI